jgi:hypothetical protein
MCPLETELPRRRIEPDELGDGERSKNVYLKETVLYPFVFKAFHYIFCPLRIHFRRTPDLEEAAKFPVGIFYISVIHLTIR